MKFLYLGFLLSLLIFIITCGSSKIIGMVVDHDKLQDGIYEGSYRSGPVKAVVEITIENQKITKVDLIKHSTWKGKKADGVIPQCIVEEQSTKVDAVSGATRSSIVIMNATQKAVEKAIMTQ